MATLGLAGQGVVLVGTVLGLWVGSRLLVDSSVRLARRLGMSDLVVGLTVVAMGTSTPELVVTADAALAGLGDIAVGNVVGSNVYNLAFVLGVVSLVRVVPVDRSLVHRDGVALVASTVFLAVVLADSVVSRVEGLLLVTALVAYTLFLLRTADASEERSDGGIVVTRDATASVQFHGRDVAFLATGLAIVLLSGHFMVESASALARSAGISEWVVGGTIVAAGTSTPEFAVSLVAVRRGSLGVSVGNVVGSNIFNALGILGVGAALRPLSVSPAVFENVLWLTAVVVAVVAALWSGRRLSRPEGGLLTLSEFARWTLGLTGVLG
jgi:cation:H+ antiporter